MIYSSDNEMLKKKGISKAVIEDQIKTFEKGIPYIRIKSAATPGNGILVFDEDEKERLIQHFEEGIKGKSLLKFVPASGAATRMFKSLFSLREKLLNNPHDPETHESVNDFFNKLPRFAFFKDLKESLEKDGHNYEKVKSEKDFILISSYLLSDKGLNYGATPKALIKFHDYGDTVRTALEEHLVEGALYGKDDKQKVKLHLTISAEHETAVKELIEKVLNTYQSHYDVTYHITYSQQKPSTDTIAVDMQNKPFRNDDGSLLFRPGGHGALIENLNDIHADIIFIKNIDNIVPDRLREPTVRYKKVIGGLLLQLCLQIDTYLSQLEKGSCSEKMLDNICAFAEDTLFIDMQAAGGMSISSRQAYLYQKLNRPVRICAMVKNEGEPGGGPFWTINPKNKEVSLQIVEASQIDMSNTEQKAIVQQATHFNPVDIVCRTKDYKGRKFDLLSFVDKDAGFISIKSKDGKDLKALELPGLWNGAMADWITIFVEVPIVTFNPVKTIDDLLRKEHLNHQQ